MKTATILTSFISIGDYEAFIDEIIHLAKSKIQSYVCFANVHMITEAYREASFQKVINEANLVTPDGKPLSVFLWLSAGIKQDRVCGMDVLPDLLSRAETDGQSVYFYGGTTELLKIIEKKAHAEYPALKIAGSCSPPFRPLSEEEDALITQTINEAGPDLVLVSLGCPKQERWMAEHKGRLNACLLGFGQAFKVYAGVEKRLPKWMRNLALEWVFRLCLEPGRLWKRYLYSNSYFVLLTIRHLVGRALRLSSHMKTLVIALMLSMGVIRLSATNYYLSNKGNDQQTGTSPSAPWRTLKRLSDVTPLLRPGDSVLFERGSIFFGQLKLSSSGEPDKRIYLGAYGSGPRPVIDGSLVIKNWTLYQDNIWVADCPGCIAEPGNLFVDDQFQPLGRYPNEGYLTHNCQKCQTSLEDRKHPFNDGYWDASQVVVKSSRWTLDVLQVSRYSSSKFIFSDTASYPLPEGYGYFIQRHLNTLDRPGEWFFDPRSKKLFLYARKGDKPGNHRIEINMVDVGLALDKANFVTIEELTFDRQRVSGIQVKRSGNIRLRRCVVKDAGVNGIEIDGCASPKVTYCQVIGSNNNGVEWNENANGVFVENSIRRTGIHPGRGLGGNGNYIGLRISGESPRLGKSLFRFNSIDSTGYIGIDFRTGATLIKNNQVSNFCLVKDDGAGIYTWGNSKGGNIIEENIVLRGQGCGAGTKDLDKVWVSGIYIDDRSADIQLKKNTVAYCGTTGIYVHNAERISIRGNTLYANGSHLTNRERSQLTIKLDNLVKWGNQKVLDLHIFGNTFVTTDQGNYCIYLQGEKEQDLKSLGQLDQNMFLVQYPDQVVSRLFGQQQMCEALQEVDLPRWQKETGHDIKSKIKIIPLAPRGSIGPNLIKNGSMATSAEGWLSWPVGVSVALDKKTGVSRPSLKVQFTSGVEEGLL